MTPLEVLRATRKLLSNPKRWTKGQWRSQKWDDSEQRPIDCYCVEGAVAVSCGVDIQYDTALYDNPVSPEQENLIDEVIHIIVEAGGSPGVLYDKDGVKFVFRNIEEVPDWNDDEDTTYEDVMEVLDKACQIAFEREQASGAAARTAA